MQELYSRDESKYIKFGLRVCIAILLAILCFILIRDDVNHQQDGSYYPIEARFNRTDGLLVGDVVRMTGITVGKITDARLDDNFKAILTLEINDDIKIPDDSSASIVSSGIMGPKYIEIEVGGSEDFIPVGGEFSYTQDAMVIEELLDRIVSIGKANKENKKNQSQDNAKTAM